jgi:uncharacterized damage-inducible protein DinB
LKVGVNVVADGLRHVMLRDAPMHTHHRGQVTVYLD